MIRNIGILCLSSLLLFPYPHYGQSDFRRTMIQFREAENAAIRDLRDALTGYNAGLIHIEKVSLDERTGQAFYLSVDKNETTIKYTTQNSLENAIYTFLDLLGFHWYGPGDNWFVKPSALRRPQLSGQWMEPSFRNRSFFGTGGLYFNQPQLYDPKNTYMQKWYDWKRRNRFNADFSSVGHTGQAFYLANKNLLDAHPEWFTGESGKVNGRIRIDQAAAVRAYKDWIRKIYNATTGEFIALGVEPEDGRGGVDDPLPAKMPGIKNHADKWWWLANEVAREYPENDKHIVITAYAYGDGSTNALAPSFPLRKNVYPVIIPYAFQTAYQPDEMVRVWSKWVTGNMGLYDYWNITQWSVGLPQFNIYSIVPKLRFWKSNKVDGIYLETTDAAGPMGHALWLAGQLQWDLNSNFDALYKQYLNDCFDGAAAYMKKMFDRWSKNYQGTAEVAFSLADLKKASAAVEKGSLAWKRILDLKAYVHFMKMYYEQNGTQQSKDALYRYLYSIHHLMMVQTAAFVGQAYIQPLVNGNVVPGSNGIRPLSESDIERQFQQDLRSASQTYHLSDFVFDYNKVKYIEPIANTAWRFGGYNTPFYFYAPYTGQLNLDVGAESETVFSFFSESKEFVRMNVAKSNCDYKELVLDRGWNMKRFKFPIEKGKKYWLQTRYGFSRVVVKSEGIVLFKNPGEQDFDNYQYPVQYFYVPKETSEIVFYDKEREGENDRGYLVAPDGTMQKRQITDVKNIYKVPVALAYRGKVWEADFGHSQWGFKNIPNITSLQKFEYGE
ncbi:DUF4838 domain-containing protein [Niabella pedocola]|uniref:DUF4838 domain-containing protein n=1 Tax=Niabella pedocola TaxID=1752077 RepID=A0ABS8PWK5_9BACT|nr:DUF4838 domain-containing protein [Niabella pedocola]MCD2425194.1 DUF4838 domain-containing protein [Niabella pedocola]